LCVYLQLCALHSNYVTMIMCIASGLGYFDHFCSIDVDEKGRI
jgi:hypothetical protein